jgi:hypothetical protein
VFQLSHFSGQPICGQSERVLAFKKNPQCLLMDIADRGYYCADFEVGGQQQWFIGFTLTCDD